ncbi:MAG TPA: hypothetical protein VJO32_17250, partial [Ktedonobacteraceae bacterium]|nr:hypothetical protein [Ktedonobacteraceae bacterium]
ANDLLSQEDAQRQRNLLQAFGLPVQCEAIDIEIVMQAMQRDKKVRAGKMRWVLATSIGHAEVFGNIDTVLVREAIAAVCNPGDRDGQGASE